MRTISGERDRAVQSHIVGIADRRDGRKPIERAAQDHNDEPGVAPVGGARKFRQIRPGCEGGAAQQQGATRRHRQATALAMIHRHLL